jgi:transcriptional regulator with XRE-family HTH domain
MSSFSSLGNEPVEPNVRPGVVLRGARELRRWSQTQLIRELQHVAEAKRLSLPTVESLKAMISRWENGHLVPDEYNRELLCLTLGISVSDLGLPNEHDR